MNEIEVIVKETIECKENEEIQVFEKCLRLVGSNKTKKERDVGFCLLARMVEKASQSSLRSMQTRLANRFSEISKEFSFCGSLFVREVLLRNPQSGELHAHIVQQIIVNTIDAAAESNDKTIRSLAAELCSLRVNTRSFELLLNTLGGLLVTEKPNNNSKDILPLSTYGITSFRFTLIEIIFECLALSIASLTKSEASVNRKLIIQLIETGMRMPRVRYHALACLRSLCENAKYSMIPMISRIVSTLISDLENPDIDLIRTLSFISHIFGPITSTLYKHFYVIFTALKHPLHMQDYGEYASKLLSSIVEGCSGLIKPEVFLTVQKSVCESAIRYIDCPLYIELVSSFLALTNENVPSPLHVARILCATTRVNSPEYRRLRSLCEIASRPRVSDIAIPKQLKTLSMKEQKVIEEPEANIISLVDDIDDDIQVIEDEVEEEINEDEPTPKRIKVIESEISSAPVVKRKTANAVPRKMETELLEGEASVDDILNLFDPS